MLFTQLKYVNQSYHSISFMFHKIRLRFCHHSQQYISYSVVLTYIVDLWSPKMPRSVIKHSADEHSSQNCDQRIHHHSSNFKWSEKYVHTNTNSERWNKSIRDIVHKQREEICNKEKVYKETLKESSLLMD